MRYLILLIMQSKLYSYLLKNVIPYIRFTTYYTSFRGKKYHRGYKKLKAGDMIVTNDSKKLTSLLIPGDFSHAAMCISKDGIWEVSEMTHTDYTKSCFFDICKEAERVVILRPYDWSDSYIKKAIEVCKSFRSATYDQQFSMGVKALYCSELLYHSDFDKTLEFNLEDLAGLGRPYLSPDGVYKCKKLAIIWDSNQF